MRYDLMDQSMKPITAVALNMVSIYTMFYNSHFIYTIYKSVLSKVGYRIAEVRHLAFCLFVP